MQAIDSYEGFYMTVYIFEKMGICRNRGGDCDRK